MKALSKDMISNDLLGKICLLSGAVPCRVIDIKEKYLLLDFPEDRGYHEDGKLQHMIHSKVYYDTQNPMFRLSNLYIHDNQNYQFKMKKYNRGVLKVGNNEIEPNILPTIDESKRLKRPVYRKDKEALERDRHNKAALSKPRL